MGKPTFWKTGEGFRAFAADCDSDHCLVVVKGSKRLAVNKQRSQRFHTEQYNLKKLNEEVGKEQFCVEVEINSAWETIRENIKISAKERLGYFELKKHKPKDAQN
jgi:hypothetical protein